MLGISSAPYNVDHHVASLDPPRLPQRLTKRDHAGARIQAAFYTHQHPDEPNALALLRACRERPRCRAAEQRYELATFHSITSLARASSVAGTSRPNASAVCRLITNSNLLACRIGRSPGFSPLRIRPV